MITRTSVARHDPGCGSHAACQRSRVRLMRELSSSAHSAQRPAFVASMEKARWRGLSICDCRAVDDELFDLEKDLQWNLDAPSREQGPNRLGRHVRPSPLRTADFLAA
jgi:hypothetical protein